VTFSIGGLVLGSSTATQDGIFFVTDIVGTTRDDISNPEVLKIAVLLQSLDSDGNPSNGITVPSEAAALTPSGDIADLPADEVLLLSGELVGELESTYTDMNTVTIAEAEAQLAVSAENIENGTITPPTAPTGSQGL